jgi:hypothetical protein
MTGVPVRIEKAAIATLLFWLAALPDVSRADAVPSPKSAVVLLGSSSINDSFGHLAASDLQRRGYAVVRKGYAAAGLSRPDFIDLPAKATDFPIPQNTEGVLLYFGGNDAQALWLRPDERGDRHDAFVKWDEQAWSDVYEERAKFLIETFCRRGVRKVIFLPPADVVSARMQRRLERIRSLQARAAESSTCGQYVSTSGDTTLFVGEHNTLRAPDGVHMTRAGAVRLWTRVASRVLELLRT